MKYYIFDRYKSPKQLLGIAIGVSEKSAKNSFAARHGLESRTLLAKLSTLTNSESDLEQYAYRAAFGNWVLK